MLQVDDLELVFDISENLLSFCSRTVNNSSGGGDGDGGTDPDLQTAFTRKWPDSDYIKHTSPALQSRDKFLAHVSEALRLSSSTESETDKSELTRQAELLAACFDVHALFEACRDKLDRNSVPDFIQVLGEIPKTASEKPQERFLVEAFETRPDEVYRAAAN